MTTNQSQFFYLRVFFYFIYSEVDNVYCVYNELTTMHEPGTNNMTPFENTERLLIGILLKELGILSL